MLGEISPYPDAPPSLTFDEALVLYFDHIEKTQRPITVQKKKSRFNVVWMPEFTEKELSELSRGMIAEIMAVRKKDGIKPNTIHNDLKELKTLFSWLIQEKHFDGENPVGKLPPVVDRKICVLNEAQAAHFLSCCKPSYYPIAATVLLTGLRKGELLDLCWSDVDLNERIIRIRLDASHKNVKGRDIPINSDLLNILQTLIRTSVYVFPGRNGKSQLVNIDKAHRAARKDAGFPDLRFHDLRHTFASMLICKGFDLSSVSQLLGHSSDRVTRRIYFHMIPDHARKILDNHPLKLAVTICGTVRKTSAKKKTPDLPIRRKCL